MSEYHSQWANFIPDGLVNTAISEWHSKRPDREQDCATPSTLTECPRVVWLKYKHHVKPPIPMGWGKAQRNLLGRQLESLIAEQLKEAGALLWWWKDDVPGESVKFEMGEDLSRVVGTPDLLLKMPDGKVAISDAKTSMGKSFGYIPLEAHRAFEDFLWFKYQLQVEAYYLLCHKNKDWFTAHFYGDEAPGGGITEPKPLPLPEACHLFSYALDDGINRREFIWKPTQDSMAKVLYYANRFNKALASETMPPCTCEEHEGTPRKFCYYVTKQETTKTGYKLGTDCCNDYLGEELA